MEKLTSTVSQGAVPSGKLMRLVTIGLGGMSVALSALIIGVVLYRDCLRTDHQEYCPPEKVNRTMKADEKTYCFRSAENTCLDRGFDWKQENNETLCCGNTNDHLYDIMAETISQRLRTDANREMFLNKVKGYITQLHHDPSAVKKRPVAHVGILQTGNLTDPDSSAPRLRWEKSGERTYLSGDIIHGGDRLTVTTPGYYYVYTALQFTVDPATSPNHAVVAYLFRNVNGTRESQRKLLTSREGSCRRTRGGGDTGPVSTYMAGIYLLRRGEEISVRTASHALLHRSSSTTYLGMHLI